MGLPVASEHLMDPCWLPSLTSSPLRPFSLLLWHPHHCACPPLAHGTGHRGLRATLCSGTKDSLGLWVPWGHPGKLWGGGPGEDPGWLGREMVTAAGARVPKPLPDPSAALCLCVSDWGCSRPRPTGSPGPRSPSHSLINPSVGACHPGRYRVRGESGPGSTPSPLLLSHSVPGDTQHLSSLPWSLVNHTPQPLRN